MSLVTRLLLAMLLMVPTSLVAQVSVIRSGEHNDFTRIVIPIPEDTNWEIQHLDKLV